MRITKVVPIFKGITLQKERETKQLEIMEK